ncbi:hypothetical protein Tco_0485472 [Tanacetum coccineum]
MQENEVFQDMQLIQKLRDDQKCMKKVEPSSRSKATKDIISIGSFVEVLFLNHYVLVRKILGKLSKLQDEDAQNKTNIQDQVKVEMEIPHTVESMQLAPCSHLSYPIKTDRQPKDLQHSFRYSDK